MALKICPGDKLLRIESFPIVGNAPNGKKTLGWLGTATRIVLQRTSDNKKALSCRAAASSSWPASNAFLQKVTQNGASRKEDKSEPEHGLTQFQEVLDTQAASNGTTLEVSTSQMVSLHLPKPLSITDIGVLPPRETADLRVAYQGDRKSVV